MSPKFLFFLGDPVPTEYIHRIPWTHLDTHPNGISIAVLTQLMAVTNRQTDRHTHTHNRPRYLCNSRQHPGLCTVRMRCGLESHAAHCTCTCTGDSVERHTARGSVGDCGCECGRGRREARVRDSHGRDGVLCGRAVRRREGETERRGRRGERTRCRVCAAHGQGHQTGLAARHLRSDQRRRRRSHTDTNHTAGNRSCNQVPTPLRCCPLVSQFHYTPRCHIRAAPSSRLE